MAGSQPVHSEQNLDYKTMKNIMNTSMEDVSTVHWLEFITSNVNINFLLKQIKYSESCK
jgi:hypothetical protein